MKWSKSSMRNFLMQKKIGHNSIKAEFEKLSKVIDKVKEKQYQYLEGMICNITKNQERKIQDNINKSNFIDPSEILRSSNIDFVERECKKFLQSVCQSILVYNDVQSRIEQMKRNQSDSVQEKMEKIAEEKADENFEKQVKDLNNELELFINSELENLGSKLKEKTFAELSDSNALKLQNSIIADSRESLKNFCEQQKISQYIRMYEQHIREEMERIASSVRMISEKL